MDYATNVAVAERIAEDAAVAATERYSTERVSQAGTITGALTTISIADAAGTPDYAIQAVTSSSPVGFASAQELISLLYVIKNLQTRVAEMAAILGTPIDVGLEE